MGIGDRRQPFGEELRGREQVAQVVVDLGDREPERREMVLLLQQRGEIELHGGERTLGGADLVVAVGRRDDAGGVLRILAEGHHVGGHAPHRTHQQEMQREVDERGGDRRDDQRQQENADREVEHRLAQRFLVEHDLDELPAHRRRSHHSHDIVVAAQQCVERVDDGAVPRHVAHVDVVVDGRRHVVSQRQQLALMSDLHGDRAGVDAVENLALDVVGDAVGRGLEHERRGIGRREPIAEPVQPEVRDRGHIDQHFRQHHEQQREDEQLARQPKARPAPWTHALRPLRLSGLLDHIHALTVRIRSIRRPTVTMRPGGQVIDRKLATPAGQPKRRSNPTMRRTQLRVKPGVKYDIAARFPISAKVGYGTTIPVNALRLRPSLIASVQVVISSPAAGPTMVAPSILPRRSAITLIWPAVVRSACARSFSCSGQRRIRMTCPRALASASVIPV